MDKNYNREWDELLNLIEEKLLPKIVMAKLMDEELSYKIVLNDGESWEPYPSNCNSILICYDKRKWFYTKIKFNLKNGEYAIWIKKDKNEQRKKYCEEAHLILESQIEIHRNVKYYFNGDKTFDFNLQSNDKEIFFNFIKGFIELV